MDARLYSITAMRHDILASTDPEGDVAWRYTNPDVVCDHGARLPTSAMMNNEKPPSDITMARLPIIAAFLPMNAWPYHEPSHPHYHPPVTTPRVPQSPVPAA